MSEGTWPESDEIKSLQMRRPHLVILGAGANLAAFPNGKRLPLMKTFADLVGLTDIRRAAGIPKPYDDLELLHSDITVDPNRQDPKADIVRYIDPFPQIRTLTPVVRAHGGRTEDAPADVFGVADTERYATN